MATAQTILWQMLTMFIFVLVGFTLSKAKLLTPEGSRGLQNTLLYVILPCVIINSFNTPRSYETTMDLLVSIGLGALALGLSMALSFILLRRDPVGNLCASFSNAGFMGIPLVAASLGQDAVFFLTGFVALLNALQWACGQYLLSDDKKGAVKGALKNPLLVGFGLGLLCYALGGLPGFLEGPVSSIAACNAPIAMIILGGFLSRVELRRGLVRLSDWLISALRLLLIPGATLAVLSLFPGAPAAMRMAILIAAAAPAGSNAAIYAQRFGKDYQKATVVVFLSTLLSIVTIPLVVMLADRLWI